MVLAASAVAFLVWLVPVLLRAASRLPDGGLGEGEAGDRRAAADHGPCRRADLGVHLDEAQGGELLQRDVEQFGFRAGLGHALAPVARVLLRRLPDERVQLGPRRLRPARQVLGDQQRDVPVGALLGHPHVGQLVVRVHHGDALGAHLGEQPGGLADPPGDLVPLGDQVGALVLVELVVVDDRVLQQPPGEPPAQRLVAQFVGLGDRLGGQLREPGLER